MMSRMLGAPLRGTTVGGQYGLESFASMLTVPSNGAGWGGRYLPSIVVVALGEPGVPVVCCANAGTKANITVISARMEAFMAGYPPMCIRHIGESGPQSAMQLRHISRI